MDKPAKPKDTFYLFRRERKEQDGYERHKEESNR